MTHLATALSATILFYTAVTRGALAVARGLEYVTRKAR